jgi:hypothetical protein
MPATLAAEQEEGEERRRRREDDSQGRERSSSRGLVVLSAYTMINYSSHFACKDKGLM